MILSKRERCIAVITLVAVFFLASDRFLLTPYLERRGRLLSEKHRLAEELESARSLFGRRDEPPTPLEKMLESDAGTVESLTLRSLRNWAEESGLALSMLKPERSTRIGQMEELSFQAIGAGSMRAIRDFLWKIESARLPIKISELQLSGRKENSDDLMLQVRVAALCLAPADKQPSKKARSKNNAALEGDAE
ncbi:MAG TPA: hypothetical protein PKN80_02055 [bacterium]|uniref:Uncharacterized protein n=1 Tax=candidate division TA06 bacterium ADurb.Bin417 TaxID=1852828 RepID=A0A1V5MDW1_UNCT6|nr:MAG: hypothetical protein BWY73_01099 [candidate division TA06 bacterium ADurb.Bin417]HNQ34828.1 hypothetical protein [bacterium]HNS49130.1 hypothetical protein [bacterium]